MLAAATTLCVLLFSLFIAFISVARFRRLRKKRSGFPQESRCPCGYLLENLEIPRCPECGSLIGFDGLKFADLGLTEDEVRVYRENLKRQRDTLPPAAP